MPEYIRVRFKDSKTEQSIARPSAIDTDAYEVLEEKATDRNGRLLPPKIATAPTYADRKIDDLKGEIERRNQGRDEADQIPATGNKPDLIAALEADDNKES